jgi:hypothetical protein
LDRQNPTGGFVINGGAAHDYSGCSVSSVGDVNGDGLDDLIVGAYFTDIYIVQGLNIINEIIKKKQM